MREFSSQNADNEKEYCKMVRKMTQKQMILNHLKEHGSITSWEAIQNYGATRLSGVIFALKEEGYNIVTHDTHGKDRYGHSKTFATYILKDASKQ